MKTAAPEASEATRTYDLVLLHDMTGGNEEFILSLVQIFLDTIPPNSREMVEACERGNWDMVSKLAHKLKSTVDMMRIESIKQDIRTIELDAKEQVNEKVISRLVYKVHETITLTAQQLQEEFQLT